MTDWQLLQSFIDRRDQTAFAELVRRHGPLVYGVCRRILGRHHDAEDVFQGTFLILARKASAVRERELLANWLYRVAYRAALRASGARARRVTREKQMLELPDPVSAPADSRWAELAPVLDRELNRLPEKYRVAVLLCDIEGVAIKAASELLGLSQGTVATRLRRGRDMLGQRLTRQGVALSVGALTALLSQQAASAAVPASLVASTAQAAGVVAGSTALPAGAVTAKVAAIVEQNLAATLFSPLSVLTVVVLTASAGAVGYFAQQSSPPPAASSGLPAEVQQALEQNAALLSPISMAYTEQNRSLISDEETFQRLKLDERSRGTFFNETEHRVIWQTPKLRTYIAWPAAGIHSKPEGYREIPRIDEKAYDGIILYEAHLWPGSKSPGNLMRRSPERLKSQGARVKDFFGSSYFYGSSGLIFTRDKDSGEKLHFESDVLNLLRLGATLVSVESEVVNEKPCVKITLEAENTEKTWADSMDLERAKKMYSGPLYPPELQQQLLDNIVAAQKLPATKRVVFFLDPAMHYALRRREEWYAPDTLLQRLDCREFEQIAGRQLWLPRVCETAYHTHRDRPGVFYADAFLASVIEVTKLDGSPVPAETFAIEYTTPGIRIEDETLPAAAGARNGQVVYTVGQTPAETEQNKAAALKSPPNQPGNLAAAGPPTKTRWILILNGIAVAAIALFLLWRRTTRVKS